MTGTPGRALFEAKHKLTGLKVAIKVITEQTESSDIINLQKKLCNALSDSKNIVKYIEHFRFRDKFYIVT